jgi:hypothetical protein
MTPPGPSGPGVLSIEIAPGGGLGERMLRYLGAVRLARRLGGVPVRGVRLPEWARVVPADPRPGEPGTVYEIDDGALLDATVIAALAAEGRVRRIVLKAVPQRLDLLDDLPAARRLFPAGAGGRRAPGENDLVISLHGAEQLDGIADRPILPVGFVREIVRRSGLRPVFVGRLGPSCYGEALRDAFPDAGFIAELGPLATFQFLRRARHILPNIGSFAWLAAWLSQARTIWLPVAGQFNPAHVPGADLLPSEDARYRFFLFPLHYGLPEREALAHHERLDGRWRELSQSQVAVLRRAVPRVPRHRLGTPLAFDPVWYVHSHPEAARELGDGWFARPLDHYLEVGRRRGYAPVPPPRPPAAPSPLPNVASGCAATQSSRSPTWSRHATLAEDAAAALTGAPTGGYSFHTGEEDCPWWQVDLGVPHLIAEIVVFNRIDDAQAVARASPLAILRSDEGEAWRTVLRTAGTARIGGADGKPLRARFDPPIVARFIRLSLTRRTCLHLDKIEVRGVPAGAGFAASADLLALGAGRDERTGGETLP